MKFTEIPKRLGALLFAPDPIVIHHIIKYRNNYCVVIMCSLSPPSLSLSLSLSLHPPQC